MRDTVIQLQPYLGLVERAWEFRPNDQRGRSGCDSGPGPAATIEILSTIEPLHDVLFRGIIRGLSNLIRENPHADSFNLVTGEPAEPAEAQIQVASASREFREDGKTAVTSLSDTDSFGGWVGIRSKEQ